MEDDNFKPTFKRLKSKHNEYLQEEILDFSIPNKYANIQEIRYFNSNETLCAICESFGLKCHYEWKFYSCESNKGLIVIPNIFTPQGQTKWVKKCIQDYPKRPNLTNIDSYLDSNNIADIWEYHQNDSTKLIKKLRWTTFGYHHNWDTKEYDKNVKSSFPKELSEMIHHIASIIKYPSFNPQAAIVNYYDLPSTISGHVDYSEYDLEAPIFSFSFGQSAIFLIGSSSKSVRPTAMFLRSGDVVVMAGESRSAYHAVPKIIKIEETPWDTSEESAKLLEYLSTTRININARQVFPQPSIS